MVEPVALLLIGRGHSVTRAVDAGLADVDDVVVADYAAVDDLVVVTFDPDFKRFVRDGVRCLHVRTPEITARVRLAEHYDAVLRLFVARHRLVTLPAEGEPFPPAPRR